MSQRPFPHTIIQHSGPLENIPLPELPSYLTIRNNVMPSYGNIYQVPLLFALFAQSHMNG